MKTSCVLRIFVSRKVAHFIFLSSATEPGARFEKKKISRTWNGVLTD